MRVSRQSVLVELLVVNIYTVFRKKHPLTFFLYLGGKCFDLHKIFGYVCEELSITSKSELNIY